MLSPCRPQRVPSAAVTAAAAAMVTPVRGITTGESHSYTPGPIARCLRRIFTAVTPAAVKTSVATRMQRGLEKAEVLEREQYWVAQHGSPLQVMGLPDHAELAEVRARYRHLVLETHPDTAKASTGEDDYQILQTAYRMATDPQSLWHRGGNSPVLYEQLAVLTGRARRVPVRGVTVFAALSYALMAAIGVFFSVVVVSEALEAALQFFDPEFYAFMCRQEEEERRLAEAGEVVNTDPKRLAPTVVRRLLFPGRFIHGEEEEEKPE